MDYKRIMVSLGTTCVHIIHWTAHKVVLAYFIFLGTLLGTLGTLLGTWFILFIVLPLLLGATFWLGEAVVSLWSSIRSAVVPLWSLIRPVVETCAPIMCAYLAVMILCIAKELWKHLGLHLSCWRTLRFRNTRSQPNSSQTIVALSISPPSSTLPLISQNQSSHLPINLASSMSQTQSFRLPNNTAPSTSQTQQPNNTASSTSQTQSSQPKNSAWFPHNHGSSLPMKFVYVWEFHEQDDCWLPFDRDQQEELEDAYCRKDSELRFPPRDGQKRHRWGRVVLFKDMTQRNEGTGKVRKIRRRKMKIIDEEKIEKQLEMQNVQAAPCNSQLKQFPPGSLFPLNTLAHTASLEKREFSKSEPDFDTLVRIFQESMTSHRKSFGSDERCPNPTVEVTKIHEIVNPFKQRFYEAAQDEVGRRNPLGCGPVPAISAPKYHPPVGHVDLNEYFLFHGTKYNQVDQIIEHGLDPQRGGASAGAMFGHGTYFAENASKSDFYTTCDQCAATPPADGKCRHPTGLRCMIVAQVLLGKTCPVTQGDSNRMRARDREDGQGPYDSHTALKRADGGCVDHMEFIIFKEQRALVRFVIFYKHKEKCECKDCLFRRT